jgi:2-dehydro-3-deoxygalactonokinase
MPAASFVAGDWGTSHLRLFLCDDDGVVLERSEGPGAAGAGGRFAEILDRTLAPWRQRHGELPAVLCGMVGSSMGWVQAPYLPCPAIPEQLADACVPLCGGSVQIVPGMSCRNRFNAPDFMRGEETQIAGALACDPRLRAGQQLLCLPGTHTKWVSLKNGTISEFLTAPTGELFALLRDHSVLVGVRAAGESADAGVAFEQGLAQFNRFPRAQLLHQLFECRARRLSGELTAPQAAGYLSGLLIASDISGALGVLSAVIGDGTVHLIGSPDLTRLYAAGLAAHHCATTQIDGVAASPAGLALIHRQLTQRRMMNATH